MTIQLARSGLKPCLLPSKTIDDVVLVIHEISYYIHVNKPGLESSHGCREQARGIAHG
jgi:hypothetical protein